MKIMKGLFGYRNVANKLTIICVLLKTTVFMMDRLFISNIYKLLVYNKDPREISVALIWFYR